jgi:succinate dehydrogenase hydrophobic anchor subunit
VSVRTYTWLCVRVAGDVLAVLVCLLLGVTTVGNRCRRRANSSALLVVCVCVSNFAPVCMCKVLAAASIRRVIIGIVSRLST